MDRLNDQVNQRLHGLAWVGFSGKQRYGSGDVGSSLPDTFEVKASASRLHGGRPQGSPPLIHSLPRPYHDHETAPPGRGVMVGAGVEWLRGGDPCGRPAGERTRSLSPGGDKDDVDTEPSAGGHEGPLPTSASSPAPTRRGSYPKTLSLWLHWRKTLFFCLLLFLALTLNACNDQSQKPDSRLKYFTVLNSRVLIEGNNAEVFGEVENMGQTKFPFDVTIQADLMDNNGQSVGNATGTAEDVGPGQVRQFLLIGTVDGTRYAKLKVMAISLQEKRQELGWPTPTPISP